MAKEIVSTRNASRYRKSDLAFVGDHAIYTPRLIRCNQAVFVDLEPFKPCHVCLQSARNLRASYKKLLVERQQRQLCGESSQIGNDGALVT